jgi:hypothetical protein
MISELQAAACGGTLRQVADAAGLPACFAAPAGFRDAEVKARCAGRGQIAGD